MKKKLSATIVLFYVLSLTLVLADDHIQAEKALPKESEYVPQNPSISTDAKEEIYKMIKEAIRPLEQKIGEQEGGLVLADDHIQAKKALPKESEYVAQDPIIPDDAKEEIDNMIKETTKPLGEKIEKLEGEVRKECAEEDRLYYYSDFRKDPGKKCGECDYRVIRFCPQARFFDASARIYFDTGKDDVDEVDVFNNGNLNPGFEFFAMYIPWRFGKGKYFDHWSWGPLLGVGLSGAAKDSDDGTKTASNSPVVIFSAGLLLEYKPVKDGASFGFEIGRALGISSDESFEDNDDSATFVGLKINVPVGKTN